MNPVYPPELVAATILVVADRPRPSAYVGAAGHMMAILHEAVHPLAPLAIERQIASMIDRDHFQDEPAGDSRGNLLARRASVPRFRAAGRRPAPPPGPRRRLSPALEQRWQWALSAISSGATAGRGSRRRSRP